MNQALSFLECKRKFNRKQFGKEVWTCLQSWSLVEHCVVIIAYNWSSSLSSSKEIEEKDTPSQSNFDISIRTIITFHHIMKLGKGIVG